MLVLAIPLVVAPVQLYSVPKVVAPLSLIVAPLTELQGVAEMVAPVHVALPGIVAFAASTVIFLVAVVVPQEPPLVVKVKVIDPVSDPPAV